MASLSAFAKRAIGIVPIRQDCFSANPEFFVRLVRQVPVATVRLRFGRHPRHRRTLRALAWRDNQKFVWRLLLLLRLVFSWQQLSAPRANALSSPRLCGFAVLLFGARPLKIRTRMNPHFAVGRKSLRVGIVGRANILVSQRSFLKNVCGVRTGLVVTNPNFENTWRG